MFLKDILKMFKQKKGLSVHSLDVGTENRLILVFLKSWGRKSSQGRPVVRGSVVLTGV